MGTDSTPISSDHALDVSSREFNKRLLALQVALFCRLSDSAMLAGLATGLGVGWILWLNYSFITIVSWYSVLLIVSIARSLAQRRIRNNLDSRDLQRTVRQLLFGLTVFGFVWSIPGTWMTLTDPPRQVALGAFMLGIAAVGISSLAPLRYAYACFVLPFLLPVAIRYLFLEHTAIIGFGTLAFILAMLAIASRQNHNVRDMLHAQLENENLTARVQREKLVIERANRDLQEQIAQRERTEAELRIAKSHAEAADRSKSQFLANMSHELRTPLNGVLGMSELLQRTPLNPKQQKYVQTVYQSGQKVLRIVGDILDMARVDAGRLHFEHIDFEPRRILADVTEQAGNAAQHKGLRLVVAVDASVPERLCGDPHRLCQVLSNLLDNAIKFTEHGTITLHVSPVAAVEQSDATDRIRLRWSVTDTGIGLDVEGRARLFQPFSQVDNSSTRKFGGTGLGLAICKQLVQAQGGRIDVTSEPDKGATFWFELPFDTVATTTVGGPSLAAVNDRAAVPATLSGLVLVAEDNLANRQLAVEMLALLGCRTRVAGNGIEALAVSEREQFDAVLMDWQMPEMDGLAATRELRAREHKDPSRRRVPIIALTASVLAGDREACEQAGMDDFLAKPFSADQLFSVLRRWLSAQTQ